MNILVVDVGGTNVKILATGQSERRKFPSGPTLTPKQMVAGVKKLAEDWEYDVVSIGYPGRVVADRVVTEPQNLGPGWIGFDFAAAFQRPVKMINDAAMQALGSYQGGTMLFIGLGTGLGSTMIVRGHIVSMNLGALSYANATVEHFLGARGLKRLGKKKWRTLVDRAAKRFMTALYLDDIVIGGGNAKKLKELPSGCRLGNNANAFIGGFRMWEAAPGRGVHAPKRSRFDPESQANGRAGAKRRSKQR